MSRDDQRVAAAPFLARRSSARRRSAAPRQEPGAVRPNEGGPQSLPVARYAAVGLAVPTAALVLANSAVGVYHRYVDESPRAVEAFNLALDDALPAYWSVVLLVVNAAIAVVLATLTPTGRRPTSRSWFVVALAFTYLALDEGYGLHERLRGPGRALADALGLQLKTYAWVLPGALIASAGFVVFALWCRTLPADVRRRFLLALVVYLSGALVLEAFNGYFRMSGAEVLDLVGTTLEESMEMAGSVLAASAMLRLVHVGRWDRITSLREHRPVRSTSADAGDHALAAPGPGPRSAPADRSP